MYRTTVYIDDIYRLRVKTGEDIVYYPVIQLLSDLLKKYRRVTDELKVEFVETLRKHFSCYDNLRENLDLVADASVVVRGDVVEIYSSTGLLYSGTPEQCLETFGDYYLNQFQLRRDDEEN